jgi:hypothetical protein
MGKYVIIALMILAGFFKSYAQNENLETPQEIEEEDMVCFLTDANTITCFVAPEEVPQNTNNQEPIEYTTPSTGSEDEVKLENEIVEPKSDEKSNSHSKQKNEKEGKMKNNKSTDYDKTKVKMI